MISKQNAVNRLPVAMIIKISNINEISMLYTTSYKIFLHNLLAHSFSFDISYPFGNYFTIFPTTERNCMKMNECFEKNCYKNDSDKLPSDMIEHAELN